MLNEGDPGKATEYKIAIVGIKNTDGPIRLVIDPRVITVGRGEVAMFLINGFYYFIDLFPSSDFALLTNITSATLRAII